MVDLSIIMLVYQRVTPIKSHETTIFLWFSSPMVNPNGKKTPSITRPFETFAALAPSWLKSCKDLAISLAPPKA